MKIIDCHGNVGWDVSNTRRNLHPVGQTAREFVMKMNQNGVSKAIIVPFPSPGGQFNENMSWYDLENNALISASRNYPGLIPFPGVNPADPISVKNIKMMVIAYGIQGVKFSHQIPMDFSIDKLINHPLMNIIRNNNLIMMVHVGTGKEKGAQYVHTTLPYAIKVAKYYPKVRFILCHLGRLHEDLFDALNLPNVWVDTAGFSLNYNWSVFVAKEPVEIFKRLSPAAIIEQLVTQGYEHKLIFGSDEPYVSYKKEIGIIQNAKISDNAKRKIFAENMGRLLESNN